MGQVKRHDDSRVTLDGAAAAARWETMHIYKILRPEEMGGIGTPRRNRRRARRHGRRVRPFLDRRSGGRNRGQGIYAGEDGLILAAVEARGARRRPENGRSRAVARRSRISNAPLRRANVLWHAPLPLVGGGACLPRGDVTAMWERFGLSGDAADGARTGPRACDQGAFQTGLLPAPGPVSAPRLAVEAFRAWPCPTLWGWRRASDKNAEPVGRSAARASALVRVGAANARGAAGLNAISRGLFRTPRNRRRSTASASTNEG